MKSQIEADSGHQAITLKTETGPLPVSSGSVATHYSSAYDLSRSGFPLENILFRAYSEEIEMGLAVVPQEEVSNTSQVKTIKNN